MPKSSAESPLDKSWHEDYDLRVRVVGKGCVDLRRDQRSVDTAEVILDGRRRGLDLPRVGPGLYRVFSRRIGGNRIAVPEMASAPLRAVTAHDDDPSDDAQDRDAREDH